MYNQNKKKTMKFFYLYIQISKLFVTCASSERKTIQNMR